MEENQSIKYFTQILEGMSILKRFKVLHIGLKPKSIYVDKNELVLGDFS